MRSGKQAGLVAGFVLMILGCSLPAALADTLYVNGTTGNDAWDGRCDVWDGGTCGPKATIQAGIDAAVAGDEVVIADGTYRGTGNKNLDFAGKAITVRSVSGNPALCVIDCEGDGRGFYFHNREGADAVVEGLTITYGSANYGDGCDGYGGGVLCSNRSCPTLMNCTITRNWANNGGGGVMCDNKSNATFIHCMISRNATRATGGGISCYDSSPAVVDCTISRNSAAYPGGGGVHCEGGFPSFANCRLSFNSTPYDGGAVYSEHSGPRFTNCTMAFNSADRDGDVFCDYGIPVFTNCILWGNALQEIHNHSSTATISATYCDVRGAWPGEGNIDADPQFALADDLHLMPGSPCIDAGTNTPAVGLPAQDSDGNPRPLDGNGDALAVADIGAYELNPALPAVALSATRVDFFGSAGGNNPADQVLSLRNCGGGTLHWEVTGTPAWLTTSPSSGDSTGAANAVTFSVDTSGLPPGMYLALLSVNAPEAANTPREVVVALHVTTALYVPNDYPTIQDAIDAAAPGDEVVLADGTHTGAGNKNLDFHGKPITVRSATGTPARCAIDCEGDGCGFVFTHGEEPAALVTGLTIANGKVSSYGGGIRCDYASPTITNCVIRDNAADDGGGVHCSGGRPTFVNCLISGNSADRYGGGVCCGGNHGAVFLSCVLSGNSAGIGNGLYCGYGGATLTNCIVWSNNISHQQSELTVTYCDVQGGWSGEGNINVDPHFVFEGDFHLLPDSPCIDAGTNTPDSGPATPDLDGNPRPLDGDGDMVPAVDMGLFEFNPNAPSIALSSTRVEFSAALGGDNPADQILSLRNCGGGTLNWEIAEDSAWLAVSPASGVSGGEVNEVVISADSSGLPHGSYNAALLISDPQAVNSPRSVVVTLYVGCTRYVPEVYPTIQSAIDAAHDGDVVEISDGRYTGEGNTDLDFRGKSITVRGASHDPASCVIDCQCTARGFFFHSGEGPGSVVEGLTITNGNGYRYGGGGVYCTMSSPTFNNCVIRGNLAGDNYGGGVHCESASPTFGNCVITQNWAGGEGGGVACRGASSPMFSHCVITRNSSHGTGGMYCYGSSPVLTNCVLWGNRPTQIIAVLGSSPAVTYCDIQGGWTAEGNIDADPRFAFSGDFRLLSGSPCIDAGTNTPVGGRPTHDPDGNARPLDGDGDGVATTDIGIYEFNRAAPSIALSADVVEFSGPEGGERPEDKMLSLRNCGGGTLHWEIVGVPAWLTPSHSSGQSTGEADDVVLTADTAGLSYGTYSAVLQVVDAQAVNSPRAVAVRLFVGHTLHVPGAHPTIQAAIDAASSHDVVVIADGTYTGAKNKNLGFNGKTLTVRSASRGPASCVIDCEGSGRGFAFGYRDGSASIVEGLTITNGNVGDSGGGIQCSLSSPTIVNCTIRGNRAGQGGGIVCDDCDAKVTHCTISGNWAENSAGGGVQCSYGSPTFMDCTISGNVSASSGGGVGAHTSYATFTKCAIHGNSATGADGGGVACSQGNPVLDDCVISGNLASASGGGIYNYHCHSVLINCTIGENTAYRGGGMYCFGSDVPELTGCTLRGNSADYGGGVYCDGTSPILNHSEISGNAAEWFGGGVYCLNGSAAVLADCVIHGNSVQHAGGGVECNSSSPTLINCTFSGNWAKFNGGGIRCFSDGNATLTNCVLWGDTPQGIYVSSASPVVTYCAIQGGAGQPWFGVGCIDADPLFVDADGPDNEPNTWADNNYRLFPDSPCIDAGSNAAVPADLLFDLDGLPRITDGNGDGIAVVDMGAYERPATIIGDLNCDGVVDFGDINPFVDVLMGLERYVAKYPGCDYRFADCNGDGLVDFGDINPFIDLLMGR